MEERETHLYLLADQTAAVQSRNGIIAQNQPGILK